MKALRASHLATFGFYPSKTRRALVQMKPKNWRQRLYWWLMKIEGKRYVEVHSSAWRRWKKLAKEGSRAQSTDNVPRGRNGRRPKERPVAEVE